MLPGSCPVFVYAMLNADGQWNENDSEYQSVQNVQSHWRHFSWSGDHVVILDRLHGITPLRSKYRLRAMSEPVIDGDTVSHLSANGEHKLLQKALEPSGQTIEKLDVSVVFQNGADWMVPVEECRWQSIISLTAALASNYLHVLQMGPIFNEYEQMDQKILQVFAHRH